MTLSSFNKKMRQKPPHVRAQWAFWCAFFATGVLALGWLAYIPGKLDRLAENYEDKIGPRGGFGRVLDSMKASVGDAFSKAKTDLASSTVQLASSTNAISSTTTDATTTDPNVIDFNTFFQDDSVSDEEDYYEGAPGDDVTDEPVSTTSPYGEPLPEPAPITPRRVLIGTSSKANTTTH